MSLKRKNIRAAIKAALVGSTDCGSRVYANRIIPVFQPEHPLILIRTVTEDVENWAEAPREYQRTLQVVIDVITEATDSLDDDLDTLGQQVENALLSDHTLGELCHDVELTNCAMELRKEGNKLQGALLLTYDVTYHSLAVLPSSDLQWLDTVNVEYDVGNASTENPEDRLEGLSSE